ncbi:SapB/AmfS family lanthipeptide [Streptomyces vinaceus]
MTLLDLQKLQVAEDGTETEMPDVDASNVTILCGKSTLTVLGCT